MSFLMEKFVYLGTAKTDEDIYGHFYRAVGQARKFYGEQPFKLFATQKILDTLGMLWLEHLEVKATPEANRRADLYMGKHIVATVQDWRTP
jgi:hypothetical protein